MTCSEFTVRETTFGGIDIEEAVLAANHSYYEAFEARDMDAMSDVWEHSEMVLCTHPGWVTLRGWGEVAASFYALFNGEGALQFLLTEARVDVRGDTAWVVVDENILGDQAGATVSALNLFALSNGQWRLVCHHASLVSPPTED